jgi:hypothetical protein
LSHLIPEPSPLDDEINIAKLKRYKSEGVDQIPIELIQAGSEILRSEIHELITSILNQEHFVSSGRSLIILPAY